MRRLCEIRTAQGEVFLLGQLLPTAGTVTNISYDVHSSGIVITCMSGAFETWIKVNDLHIVTSTAVESSEVIEYQRRRALCVSELSREQSVETALKDTAGYKTMHKEDINPR